MKTKIEIALEILDRRAIDHQARCDGEKSIAVRFAATHIREEIEKIREKKFFFSYQYLASGKLGFGRGEHLGESFDVDAMEKRIAGRDGVTSATILFFTEVES